MKITVPKNEFLDAIASLGKIAMGRVTLPDFQNVHITANLKNQTVRIAACDFDQALHVDLLLAKADADVSVSVSCAQLRSLVRACGKDGDITLLVSSETLDLIENDQMIGQLPLAESEIVFPSPTIPQDAESVVLPTTFPAFMADASCCISDDPARALLHGVCISGLGVTATDGRELFHVPLPFDSLRSEMVLKLTPALASIRQRWLSLAAWPDGATRYVAIQGKSFQYTAKVPNGKYPNWQAVLPEESSLVVSVKFTGPQSQQMKEYLRGIDKNAGTWIELTIQQGQVTVKDASARKIFLPAEIDGCSEPCSITMGGEYLAKLFKFGHDTLLLNPGGGTPMKCIGGSGFYLFMGCTLTNSQTQAPRTAAGVQPNANTAETQNPDPMPVAATKPEIPAQNTEVEPTKMPEITSPVPTPSSHPISQDNQEKGKQTMERPHVELKPIPVNSPIISDPEATPMEEASQCLDDLREEVKSISEKLNQVSRKFKEALLQQRQKDRQYFTTVKKLERIRNASGF